MRNWLEQVTRWLQARRSQVVHLSGAQWLGPGLAVYALDVDGRRIILGVSTHAMCVLDRYSAPPSGAIERDPRTQSAKSDSGC